ncbi:hypothetical protein ACMYR2_3528 [Nitrobacter sp. TKz-YC01]
MWPSAKLQTFVPASAALALLAIVLYAMILPFYEGSEITLFSFVASGTLLFGCAAALRPSFFVVVLASFLTLGFLLKAVAHLTFGAELIEPVGDFSGSAAQWDTALTFAAAGQFGGVASIILASFIPSHSRIVRTTQVVQRKLGNILFGALALLIVVATCVYSLNYRYAILRIGYPLGIDIDPRVYAVLAFIITWGALLGGLALTQWLIELQRLRYASLLVVASYLGFLSSLTMGSRVQFLLYILAAVCIVILRWRNVPRWAEIVVALCVAGLLFILSIAVVSVERNYAFHGGQQIAAQNPTSSTIDLIPVVGETSVPEHPVPPQPSSPTRNSLVAAAGGSAPSSESQVPMTAPNTQQPLSSLGEAATLVAKFDAVISNNRLNSILKELRSLVVMRWIGLEGVLTAEGAERALGRDLLLRGLTEDPAAGKNGIYQNMSGDPYGRVEIFTFLTLPGIIGFASYSGSVPLIFGFVFCTVLAGHLLEWIACSITRNAAVGAVSGVSLAYLTVQMGFPRTLFIYAIELCLACAALGGFWFVSRRLATSRI